MASFDKNFTVRLKAFIEKALKESGVLPHGITMRTNDLNKEEKAWKKFMDIIGNEPETLKNLKLTNAIVPAYGMDDTVYYMHENHIIKGKVKQIKTKTIDWSTNDKEDVQTEIRYTLKKDMGFAYSDDTIKLEETELYTSPDGIIEDLLKDHKEENPDK